MTRRNQPAVHVVHGISSTLASSSFIHFQILEKLVELDHPYAIKFFIEAGKIHHQAEAIDIYWREILKCPTLSEYLALSRAKSANFLVMIYKIMNLFSTNKHDLGNFVNLFGELKIKFKSGNFKTKK